MIDSPDNERRALRWAVYCLLIVTAAGSMVGRILAVQDDFGATPFLSANDRSRWCTIRALVDDGTYEIDSIIREEDPETGRRYWMTIDRVRHHGWDGREHDYSSKPPLLPTLLAGQYWILQQLSGVTIADEPFYIARTMLILTNVLPLLLYMLLLVRVVESWPVSDWSRLFVMAFATMGTFLTTFAVTLNNHLPAAISAFITVYVMLPMFSRQRTEWWRFAVAGLFAAFAATNELPALSLFALVAMLLLWVSPLRWLVGFLPAAAVVAAGFFGTNYLAHGSWKPPYAHRSDGPLVTMVPEEVTEKFQNGAVPSLLKQALAEEGYDISGRATIQPRLSGDGWVLWDPQGQVRLAVMPDNGQLAVHQWGNWYEYPGSYWLEEQKTGVDQGEPSRFVYAFNVLFGHHGVFSLAPVWLLAIPGVFLYRFQRQHGWHWIAAMILVITVVCTAFYIARPLIDRNYGGVTSGFRWLFWLIPLWMLYLIPAADWLGRHRTGRVLAYLALLISVLSATFPALNPWQHPWIFQYWSYLGWIEY